MCVCGEEEEEEEGGKKKGEPRLGQSGGGHSERSPTLSLWRLRRTEYDNLAVSLTAPCILKKERKRKDAPRPGFHLERRPQRN